MDGPEIYKLRTVSEMAGFWSHPLCLNCQALLSSNLLQPPYIEEDLSFATNLGPEQLQGYIFSSPPSGTLQSAGPLYAPSVSTSEAALKDQSWSNTSEQDDRSSKARDAKENPSVPPSVAHTAEGFTATGLVALHPAASSPASKPTCPNCKKSFTRISDLNRHYHQIHRRLRWNCHLECGNNRGNGWSREDKWKDHIRREHPSFSLAKPGKCTKGSMNEGRMGETMT